MNRQLATLALPLALAITGCTAEAAGSHTVSADSPELAMAGVTESGHWQSAPWTDSVWIDLGTRATVTVQHGLERQPATVQVYLSFVEDDRDDSAKRTAFPAAGDVANIEAVTDTEVIIRNTTQGEFYMRLALQ